MKNKVLTMVVTIAMLSFLCLPIYASEETTYSASGFYNIGAPEYINVTPMAGDEVVPETFKDVNEDGTDEKFYANSSKLKIECSKVTAGAFYGIVIVEGTDLPTKDNAIFYLDQTVTVGGRATFYAQPKVPAATGVMTVYITNNVGEDLMSFTVGYAVNVDLTPEPEYTLGDVDCDGDIGAADALQVLKISVGLHNPTKNERLAADVSFDKKITSLDALRILKYSVGLIESWK